MTGILFVSEKPETIDFSEPVPSPGFDPAKIYAGIAAARQLDREW